MVKGSKHTPETLMKLRDAKLGKPGYPHRKGVPISKNAIVHCRGCGIVISGTTANRKWCPECKKEVKKQSDTEYRKIHHDEELERHRKFYQKVVIFDQARLRKYAERSRSWYQETRPVRLEAVRRYRAEHPEYLVRKNEYEKMHPEKRRIRENRRRAIKRNAPGSHTIREFYGLCESLHWRCVYCGTAVTKKTVSQDHKIPLSRGGSDSIENIAPSCRSCNFHKSVKTVDEFVGTLLCKEATG